MIVRRLADPLVVPPGAPTAGAAALPDGWRAPFDARVVTVAPGAETVPHEHHETEAWLVVTGAGSVDEDGRETPVSAGDLVLLPPLGRHRLRNASATESLVFLTAWWEDPEAFEAAAQARMTADTPADRLVLLLPSFPTPNGDLHVGHLAGPYVAADVCRRALLLEGADALLLLGTVGHQSHVAAHAEDLGISFYEAAEARTAEIVATLAAAEVEADVFVRPTDVQRYGGLARDVFARLRATGAVVERERPASYCATCDRFVFEAFVVGTCPHCGDPGASGTECEGCGRHHDDSELASARCTVCDSPATHRTLRRFFLPLEPHRATFEALAVEAATSPRVAAFMAAVLAEPLPEVPVSHVADSGIELAVPGFEDQRQYSAFELAARFLAALAATRPDGDWEQALAGRRPELVTFFGHDNLFLRAFVFPAVLAAYSEAAPLPTALVMNEFYELDGEKFSTGRDHAIWGRDLIDGAGADAVRFHVAATRPEDARADFTLEDFAETVEGELAGRWEAWLREADARLGTVPGRAVPEAGGWTPQALRFHADLRAIVDDVRAAYRPGEFSTRRAVRRIGELVVAGRAFGRASEELAGAPGLERLWRTHLALELMALRALALLAAPLMPAFAAALLAELGSPPPAECRWGSAVEWLAPGTPVGPLRGPFFPRLERVAT